MHKYIDEDWKYIEDSNWNILEDIWDESSQNWTEATIKNSEIRNNMLELFKTPEWAEYLWKVIDALPKDKDWNITAYRIWNIWWDSVQSYTLSEWMAKTFSNVWTDIIPSVWMKKWWYKDFWELPHNIVKIDPKWIEWWSPYDSEILVSPKYVSKYIPESFLEIIKKWADKDGKIDLYNEKWGKANISVSNIDAVKLAYENWHKYPYNTNIKKKSPISLPRWKSKEKK